MMDYLDFEIEINFGEGNKYPIAVIRSAGGEARATMQFPFDELALTHQLLALQNALLRSGSKRRRIFSQEEQIVQNFGRALFYALFSGEVLNVYRVSQREAINKDKGLRVKLRILPPELAVLPWEFLFDERQEEYICLSSNTPIVRYMELPHPLPPLVTTAPLRILGMIASPEDISGLDAAREQLRLDKALEPLRSKGMIELTWLQGHTWRDLQRVMRHGPWHIFHFIGHGGFDTTTEEGLIALEDEEKQTHYLRATSLGRLLTDHRPLRLVVLNSCEGARGSKHDALSSTSAILVKRGIPAVLAMQYEITDRAAIELSRVFYEAIADGMPVDTSVAEARKAISIEIENTVEWGTPVLYMRSPNGILFDIDEKLAHDTPKKSPALTYLEINQASSGERIDEIEAASKSSLASVVDELPDWDDVTFEDTTNVPAPPSLATKPEDLDILPDWDDVTFEDIAVTQSSTPSVTKHSNPKVEEVGTFSVDEQDEILLSTADSSISLQEVRRKWELIKRRVKTRKDGSMIAAILNDYIIVDVENTKDISVLILKASGKFHYDTLMKNERYKNIEWALEVELGKEFQVRLIHP